LINLAVEGSLLDAYSQKILHRSLDEEREIDVLLTRIAKTEVNPDALAA
jgi:hypothetical protein